MNSNFELTDEVYTDTTYKSLTSSDKIKLIQTKRFFSIYKKDTKEDKLYRVDYYQDKNKTTVQLCLDVTKKLGIYDPDEEIWEIVKKITATDLTPAERKALIDLLL